MTHPHLPSPLSPVPNAAQHDRLPAHEPVPRRILTQIPPFPAPGMHVAARRRAGSRREGKRPFHPSETGTHALRQPHPFEPLQQVNIDLPGRRGGQSPREPRPPSFLRQVGYRMHALWGWRCAGAQETVRVESVPTYALRVPGRDGCVEGFWVG